MQARRLGPQRFVWFTHHVAQRPGHLGHVGRPQGRRLLLRRGGGRRRRRHRRAPRHRLLLVPRAGGQLRLQVAALGAHKVAQLLGAGAGGLHQAVAPVQLARQAWWRGRAHRRGGLVVGWWGAVLWWHAWDEQGMRSKGRGGARLIEWPAGCTVACSSPSQLVRAPGVTLLDAAGRSTCPTHQSRPAWRWPGPRPWKW